MEAVRDALEDLLSKNNLQLEEMGSRAHALVGRDYTWKMAADRSAALYAWLTASGDEPDFIIRNR
jgi:glycosyltransferase involved in cell wall biosynthesis